MLGFLIGTISLIGLVRLLRHRRGGCGYGHGYGLHQHGGCGHHGHHGHHRGHRGGGRFGGFDRGYDRGYDGGFDDDGNGFGFDDGRDRVVFLRSLFTRLETTPGQERVIVEALKELKGAYQKNDSANRKSARDLGEALQGEQLSMDAMGSVFASLDEGTAAIRDGAFSSLTKIHEALDARQRKVLAELLSRGGGLKDLAAAV